MRISDRLIAANTPTMIAHAPINPVAIVESVREGNTMIARARASAAEVHPASGSERMNARAHSNSTSGIASDSADAGPIVPRISPRADAPVNIALIHHTALVTSVVQSSRTASDTVEIVVSHTSPTMFP